MTHSPHSNRPHRERFSIPEPLSGSAHSAHSRQQPTNKWKIAIVGVFVLVTILVLVNALTTAKDSGNESGVASTATQQDGTQPPKRGEGPIPDGEFRGLKSSDLPPGAPYTQRSSEKFRTVGTPGERFGEGTKDKYTYVVEVEDTIDGSSFGGLDAFASMVDATLANPKSWIADKEVSFQHVNEEDLPPGKEPDFRFQLATAETTHGVCGNTYQLETSCFMPIGNRVVLNESRWIRGAISYAGDIGSYRQYMINHELGHGIGYAAHQPCSKDGALAPLMMQQTLSLSNSELRKINPDEVYENDGKTCVANPWPYPTGEKTDQAAKENGTRSN